FEPGGFHRRGTVEFQIEQNLRVAQVAEHDVNLLPARTADPVEECGTAIKHDRIRVWREYVGGAVPDYRILGNNPIECRFPGCAGGKSQSLEIAERAEGLNIFNRFS